MNHHHSLLVNLSFFLFNLWKFSSFFFLFDVGYVCNFVCFCFSEPPDIANWFSSYAYESPPVLDTNDALYFSVGGEDSECVKETQAEEEEEIGGKYVCPSLFDQQQLVSSAKVLTFL